MIIARVSLLLRLCMLSYDSHPPRWELNPVESIWSQVRGQIASENKTFEIVDVEPSVYECFARVVPTKLACCIRHLIEEEVMREMYSIIHDVMNKAVVSLSYGMKATQMVEVRQMMSWVVGLF